MELSDFDKSRVRYHLGYFTVSVPAGDYARLEEAMNTIPDSFFNDKLLFKLEDVILLKRNRSSINTFYKIRDN